MAEDWFTVPGGWDEKRERVWESSMDTVLDEKPEVAHAMANDEFLQFLYDQVYWEPNDGDMRSGMYRAIEEYVRDKYDVEWEDIFDWEDWRASYDAA